MKATPNTRRAGFTLIEIMAVVAIMMMITVVGLPRIGNNAWDPLEDEAENIAQTLRFARQRAIMTGTPHRLLIDLEEGGYQIEWMVTEDRAFGESSGGGGGFAGALFGGDGGNNADDEGVIDFTPPRKAERDYYPIPHRRMGTFHWLDDSLFFVGIESDAGWAEGGDYAIVFYVDGTTDSALVELSDSEDHHLTLAIEPILQQVRLFKGGARS
jgi:prepilin-type N-terminal cleavage/methylation domain-containing protein